MGTAVGVTELGRDHRPGGASIGERVKVGQGTRQLERGQRPWGLGRALRHPGEGSERLLSGTGQG